jgi:hypothetical protein
LFIYTGVTGFLASKRNSETALKAQVVLDRLSAELRHVESIDGALLVQSPSNLNSLPLQPTTYPDAKITYRSKDFGNDDRQISYESGKIVLRVPKDKEPPYDLLDNVDGLTLYVDAENNMDGSVDGSEEVSAIKINFIIKDVGTTFSVRIYPRNFITKTW